MEFALRLACGAVQSVEFVSRIAIRWGATHQVSACELAERPVAQAHGMVQVARKPQPGDVDQIAREDSAAVPSSPQITPA